MFNLWDWIVGGILYLLDLMLIPLFNMIGSVISTGQPFDQSISLYIRAAIRTVYPIVSVLNFLPFVMAAMLAFNVTIIRKLISVYFFIVDLIPGLR